MAGGGGGGGGGARAGCNPASAMNWAGAQDWSEAVGGAESRHVVGLDDAACLDGPANEWACRVDRRRALL